MAITKEVTKLENSAVKLTVTIPKKEVEAGYNDLLKKYSKTIQIPGFRKGHVPVNVLERKYGEALKADASGELIEKALTDIFEDKTFESQPLPYSQPAMDEAPDLDFKKDLTFSVVYDVMPEVTVGDFKGISIEVPEVSVGKKELDEELKAIQERNALVVEKKDGSSAAKDDVVTVNYSELDDKDVVIAGTERQDFVFTVGTEQNLYKFDNDIVGMKKGETKDITKKFAKDFEDKDLAGTEKKIRVELTALKTRDLPALDDELAQDVNEKYKTLDDLKKDITKNLETALENRMRELKSNALIEQLIERNPIVLPESMVKAELESRWRMMARQFQTTPEQLEKMFGGATGNAKETMLKEWEGESQKMLKGRLIVENLLKQKEIAVSDEEVEAEFAKIAEGANMDVAEVKKHYEDAMRKEYLIDDVKEQKLYADIFKQIEIKKGKKQAFADLFKNS